MKIKTIKWKNRFPSAGVSPERAYSAIEKVRLFNGGVVTPEAIIEAAEATRNPLHKLFEWDDTSAARKFRVTQAATLYRSLEITYVGRKGQPVRAYEIITHSVRGKPEEERVTLYSTHEEVLSDPKARKNLIRDAISQLKAFKRRYHDLNEFSKIFKAIDELE